MELGIEVTCGGHKKYENKIINFQSNLNTFDEIKVT